METLREFTKVLCEFQVLARARQDEYLNSRWSDTPFEIKTLYEMMMNMLNRLEKIEKVMEPAPEKVADAEADALGKPKKGRLY